MGIAGVNTRPLMRAADPMVGIAGNWGSTLRPHVERTLEPGASISKARLGDQAALHASKRACHFLDYTYLACPDRRTGRMRYRPGFAALCAPETRRLPMFLDSAAYREFTGGAPSWSSYARYCETIDLVRPDGAMAKDTVGDQEASRRGYERMCRDGYRDMTIPVWQVMPSWVNGLSVEANARLAARDPVLRFYCDRAPLVAIGGLNQSPCRRSERHLYLQTLCRAFPDTQFWGLGQANPVVVNGLGLRRAARPRLGGRKLVDPRRASGSAGRAGGRPHQDDPPDADRRPKLLPPPGSDELQPALAALRLRRALDVPGPGARADRHGGSGRSAGARRRLEPVQLDLLTPLILARPSDDALPAATVA